MDCRLSSATAGVRDFILPTCISFCFFFIYWVVGQVMTHFCKVSTLTRGRKSRHGDHILNHDAKYITVHFHSHPPDRHAPFSSFFPNSCIFLVCFFLHYSLLFSFPCPHFSSSFKIITVICLGPETTPNQTAQNKEPELSTYIISKSLQFFRIFKHNYSLHILQIKLVFSLSTSFLGRNVAIIYFHCISLLTTHMIIVCLPCNCLVNKSLILSLTILMSAMKWYQVK